MSQFEPKLTVDEVRKEIEATWHAAHKQILAMRAEIARLKLEITALKTYLNEEIPSFHKHYPQILDKTIQQVPPE